jgi:hypothetical protein
MNITPSPNQLSESFVSFDIIVELYSDAENEKWIKNDKYQRQKTNISKLTKQDLDKVRQDMIKRFNDLKEDYYHDANYRFVEPLKMHISIAGKTQDVMWDVNFHLLDGIWADGDTMKLGNVMYHLDYNLGQD